MGVTAPDSRPAPTSGWRTEGLPPKDQDTKQRRTWIKTAIVLLGYLVVFAVLTLQDQMSGPQPVPYTEFKAQVANKNVNEVFARGDSIQGQLKKEVPVAGEQGETYQQFTTERP